jgi:hypothetical protein
LHSLLTDIVSVATPARRVRQIQGKQKDIRFQQAQSSLMLDIERG